MGNTKAISDLYNLSGLYWIVSIYKDWYSSLLMNMLYQRVKRMSIDYSNYNGLFKNYFSNSVNGGD
jgi:hypothetical protein